MFLKTFHDADGPEVDGIFNRGWHWTGLNYKWLYFSILGVVKLLVEAVNVYKYVGAKQEIMNERVVHQFD